MTVLSSFRFFRLPKGCLTRVQSGYQKWNEYFFQEASYTPLCLYRIVFCSLICVESLSWLPYAEELFSADAFHIRYSFFSAQMSTFEAQLFCILLGLTSLFAALGYFTRLNIFLTLIFFALLHSVDSINEKAVESIIMVVLTVLFFSPCNRLYSLDVAIGRVQRKDRGCMFTQRLLQWEFAQIYFFCGVTKMMVPDWPSGKVFIDSLTGRWASPIGIWISGWIPEWTIRAFGFGTILFELFVGPLLLSRPLRWLAVGLALSFHLGIETALSIGSLGMHFMAADLFLFFHPDKFHQAVTVLASWCQPLKQTVLEWVRSLRPAAPQSGALAPQEEIYG